MVCHDNSYANALKNGLNYGLTAVKPYAYQDGSQISGNEWDILQTAAAYVGITKINANFAPFQTLLPSLLAKKIDMFPAHETATRDKVISFSSPGYWYGPTTATRRATPPTSTDSPTSLAPESRWPQFRRLRTDLPGQRRGEDHRAPRRDQRIPGVGRWT